jgi:histidine triad (HIT) family protein
MNCVFCKIVRGEESARKVYEDEKVLAFYTIAPEANFHVLVIPKEHFERFDELDGETAYYLLQAVAKIARSFNLDHFRVVNKNGFSAGQRVPHLHIHILSGNLPKGIIP